MFLDVDTLDVSLLSRSMVGCQGVETKGSARALHAAGRSYKHDNPP